MPTLQEILTDTAEYVAWKLEEGETSAEVSRAILDELVVSSTRTSGSPATAAAVAQHAASIPAEQNAEKPSVVSGASSTLPPATTATSPMADKGKDMKDEMRAAKLAAIAAAVRSCTLCPLHADRTNGVPGQGNPNPDILFVGEAPGADEDAQGLAFVGRAGQLLTKMIEAMGFTREDVFIANVNKCRPPANRKPLREEMDACLPYLRQQVKILQPKVIVAMGATAVEGLVPESVSQKISDLRGHWLTFEGIPLMPTYHPAYLLRNSAMKKPVWADLQEVLRKLGRPVPKRSTSG